MEGSCNLTAESWLNGAGYREACNLAYKRLEEVSINNSANVKAFRQVLKHFLTNNCLTALDAGFVSCLHVNLPLDLSALRV